MLNIGDPAPDFSVPDDEGRPRTLAEFAGRSLVLWFYPKADTPGWTVEGKGFRDMKPDFDAKGAELVGVSFDTVAENRAFRTKFDFPYPLLCDTTRALGIAYGAAKDAGTGHAARITVVVGKDGKIAKVYPKVDPSQHPRQVLADLPD